MNYGVIVVTASAGMTTLKAMNVKERGKMNKENAMMRMNALNNAMKYAEMQLNTKQINKVSLEIIQAIAKKFENYLENGKK